MKIALYSFIIFLLLCPTVSGQIKIKEKYDEYEPIVGVAETDSDINVWQLVGSAGKKYKKITVNNGKEVHVWAEPGKYDLSLTAIKIVWDKKEVTYNEYYSTFEVLAKGPKPPDDPDPPNPSTFKGQVKAALSKVDSSALSHKTKVAEVYSGIAKEAEAQPDSWDAALMVNEAKVRNATVLPTEALSKWAPFWTDLAKALQGLNLPAEDLKGHIQAFKDIAEVLNS